MNIQQVKFDTKNYYQVVHPKTQIVIHHTVSGEGVTGDIAWWNKTADKEGTAYIIDRQGVIHQLFDDKYWAYHLGLKKEHFTRHGLNYKNLNENSIGIELDNWGPVLPYGGKYYPVKWDGKKHIPNTNAKPITGYPEEYCGDGFHKCKYFERYTTLQLNALTELLSVLCNKYDILKQYKGDRFWHQSAAALSGEPGIWGHTSFRPDKSDPHPQPDLVNVLKSIK